MRYLYLFFRDFLWKFYTSMLQYIIRRLFYVIPLLLGVNFITFTLFFIVNTPDDMARFQLGDKHVTEQAIVMWKEVKGYDKPLFYNDKKIGIQVLTETIFFDKSIALFLFNFGQSESGRDITNDVLQRMWPSLYIAIPAFLLSIWVNICVAFLALMFRNTGVEKVFVISFITLLSISYMLFILGGQFIFAKVCKLVPISGFQTGIDSIRFLVLPVFIGVVSGIGSGGRWYRALFLEEVDKSYVQAAKAKGLSEFKVLYRHIFPNALIPIVSSVVVIIPLLFMGALITESFFSIPGLGSYMLDALNSQDFSIVRTMVFIGSFLYIIGLLITDIIYTIVDPRIRLN